MATQSRNVAETISNHLNMDKQKHNQKHSQNNTKKESIKWPNYVIYEGNVIYASLKEPNYAIYMLPAGQMNRRLVLSRTTYLNHLRYGNKNDYTWEGINKGTLIQSQPHQKIHTTKIQIQILIYIQT